MNLLAARLSNQAAERGVWFDHQYTRHRPTPNRIAIRRDRSRYKIVATLYKSTREKNSPDLGETAGPNQTAIQRRVVRSRVHEHHDLGRSSRNRTDSPSSPEEPRTRRTLTAYSPAPPRADLEMRMTCSVS
jgi:hypothetical protein